MLMEKLSYLRCPFAAIFKKKAAVGPNPFFVVVVVLQVIIFEAEFGLAFVRTGLAVTLAVAPMKPSIPVQKGETV